MTALRQVIEALPVFHPGADGCEENQPDWKPEPWDHIERAAVLTALTIPARTAETCWVPWRHDDPSCPQYRRTK